jgi:hypothetical protein
MNIPRTFTTLPILALLAFAGGCGTADASPDSDGPTAMQESQLLEPPQGEVRHVGRVGVAVFEAQRGVPIAVAAVATASFTANHKNQYRTSYHLVPGGFCEKLWLTTPFDASQNGTIANAGTVTISNPQHALTLQPVGPGIYPPASAAPAPFAFGDQLTITVAGSSDGAFAGFETHVRVPYPAAQSAPADAESIAAGEDLALTWTGAATQHRQAVRYRLEQVVGDAPQPPNGASPPVERQIVCYFDARRGHGSIPASLLTFMRGHTINTFFESSNTDLVLRRGTDHDEQTDVTVGNATQLRRLQLEPDN